MTSIEWTSTVNPDGSIRPGSTWNPIRGCSRVSSGCTHCYAERIAARFSGPKPGECGTVEPFNGFAEMTKAGPRWTGRVELIPEKLDEPLHWKKPRRVFVNSMSDLFHEALPDEAILSVFRVMHRARQHTYQVLTKRPERMREFMRRLGQEDGVLFLDHLMGGMAPYLGHVWLGVSCEDQTTADERIPLLLQTQAAVRWVSAEPLLGPINLREYLGTTCQICQCRRADFALDDQVRHQRGEQRSAVTVAGDLPRAHPLPSTARTCRIIPAPSNATADRRQEPLHDASRGAVNGNPGAVRPASAASPVEIPLSIEEPREVTENSTIAGNANRPRGQGGAGSAGWNTSGTESSLNGSAARSEATGEYGDGLSSTIAGGQGCGCDCHRLHTRHSITWLVVGGESGPGARPCDVAWIRSIVRQCREAGVPVFVKQMGSGLSAHTDVGRGRHMRDSDTGRVFILKHPKGGDPAEWSPEDLRVREFPK